MMQERWKNAGPAAITIRFGNAQIAHIHPNSEFTILQVDRHQISSDSVDDINDPFKNGMLIPSRSLVPMPEEDKGEEMKFDIYEHDTKKWPNGIGIECFNCGLACKVGQPIVAARGRKRGTVAFHYECVQELAEFEPTATRYDRIVDRIASTNGDPFGFKERNGF